MRDFVIDTAVEIASAIFVRISAVSARRREARRRRAIEAELAGLRAREEEIERRLVELEEDSERERGD